MITVHNRFKVSTDMIMSPIVVMTTVRASILEAVAVTMLHPQSPTTAATTTAGLAQ